MSATLKAPLLIARHARAAANAGTGRDIDRPLDPTGQADAAAMAERLRHEGFALGHVICSPARRCRETAAALAASLTPLSLREEQDFYSGGLEAYLAAIEGAEREAALTLVGHNPSVDQLAHHLLGAEQARLHLPAGFPPGAILCLERPARGQFVFHAFLQP